MMTETNPLRMTSADYLGFPVGEETRAVDYLMALIDNYCDSTRTALALLVSDDPARARAVVVRHLGYVPSDPVARARLDRSRDSHPSGI